MTETRPQGSPPIPATDETCELLVKVTPTTVEAYLSVDGGSYRQLSVVETATLLSDLALATSAQVLLSYTEHAPPIGERSREEN